MNNLLLNEIYFAFKIDKLLLKNKIRKQSAILLKGIKDKYKNKKVIVIGNGPSLLEMKTYRYRGHSMSDAQKYRTKEEVNEYRKIDAIIHNNYASEDDIKVIDDRVKAMVAECQKFAEESPFPEINVMYDAVYEQKDYPFLKHKL